jgi:hypothetical protein
MFKKISKRISKNSDFYEFIISGDRFSGLLSENLVASTHGRKTTFVVNSHKEQKFKELTSLCLRNPPK